MSETKQLPGLTTAVAQRLLKQYGPNQIAEGKKYLGLWAFLIKFKNPLVLILVFAATISALTGDPVSAGIIIAIVVLSVFLDFVNSYKSEKAAEELREKVQVLAHVYRDGSLCELPLRLIVPGDTVLLSAGDVVPADGVFLEAKDCYVNESSLTGESFPAEKETSSEVFMGTSVITGNAVMKVEKTGRQTRFSRIAESLGQQEQPTDFDRGIKDFSYLIMKITFVLVIFIFLVNAVLKGPEKILQSFLFSAALAVGLTPELLPMIIALNLSKGSMAMSKHGVIVKKLSAIQNFGAMDVLCTDKTGTLTEDKIVLVQYVDAQGRPDEDIFHHAYLSSSFRSGFRNPLDKAVRDFKTEDLSGYKKIDEIPFDFERKRDSVVLCDGQRRVLISKGAPEEMFAVCDFYKSEHQPITDSIRSQLDAEYRKLSSDGFRVLAVSAKKVKEQKVYDKEDEHGLVILGFIAFLDPPKKTVTETLRQLEQLGIEIKIITGDNELVAQKVAQEIHLPVKGVVVGKDLLKLTDQQLQRLAERSTVFARVTPDQKQRIIEAIKRGRHVVGYMGDGINDAPSLRAADVGISVNNAVDVAKDSADIILLQKSLKQLVNGVKQGRRTFANTLKYLMMALSSNFGNMFSMAGASLFFSFLPMLPEQILFNNLLYDGSQFAIPQDNVSEEVILKPKHLNIRFIKKFMLVFGPLSSLFDFATFFVLSWGFSFKGSLFQTGWFLESLATQSLVIFIIRSRKLNWKENPPALALVLSTGGALLAGSALAFSPWGHLFTFSPLPWRVFACLVGIVLVYLGLVEMTKRWFYKHYAE